MKKMKKHISFLAHQHKSDMQKLQDLSNENNALHEECAKLEGNIRRENVSRIARLSRNDGIDSKSISEPPVADVDDEE